MLCCATGTACIFSACLAFATLGLSVLGIYFPVKALPGVYQEEPFMSWNAAAVWSPLIAIACMYGLILLICCCVGICACVGGCCTKDKDVVPSYEEGGVGRHAVAINVPPSAGGTASNALV